MADESRLRLPGPALRPNAPPPSSSPAPLPLPRQAAHAALDQREKVKAKLVQTQRDSALEKAHKLAQLAELASKCEQLEHEFAAKQASIDEHEQSRRRVDYAAGKQRRLAQHQAETKTGFLQSQVDGWNSEFQRLQVFTGMDKVFAPGDDQTIDEITTRYLSKDQQNTSLLRYLHAQQARHAPVPAPPSVSVSSPFPALFPLALPPFTPPLHPLPFRLRSAPSRRR